jgi:hypothetical protein
VARTKLRHPAQLVAEMQISFVLVAALYAAVAVDD